MACKWRAQAGGGECVELRCLYCGGATHDCSARIFVDWPLQAVVLSAAPCRTNKDFVCDLAVWKAKYFDAVEYMVLPLRERLVGGTRTVM